MAEAKSTHLLTMTMARRSKSLCLTIPTQLLLTDCFHPRHSDPDLKKQTTTSLYVQLVKALKTKVMFPPHGGGWTKDQIQKFKVYRRDVGDTLINA